MIEIKIKNDGRFRQKDINLPIVFGRRNTVKMNETTNTVIYLGGKQEITGYIKDVTKEEATIVLWCDIYQNIDKQLKEATEVLLAF